MPCRMQPFCGFSTHYTGALHFASSKPPDQDAQKYFKPPIYVLCIKVIMFKHHTNGKPPTMPSPRVTLDRAIPDESAIQTDSSADEPRMRDKTANATCGNDNYSFDDLRGWRRFRILRPGRGMYHDVKRRLPYYWSDIRDAWTYRTVASIIRMYFVK